MLVNERPVSVASREVAVTDRIAIVDEVPDLASIAETAEWIAIDKPSGMAVQPARDRARRSAEELLRVQLKQRAASPELYLVHRIDTGTSGVVLFARTREAAATLSRLFAEREMRKVYLAVAEGVIETSLTIDTPIDNREAATTIRPLGASDLGTLVEAEIHTGRTHQIRVHLASIGHPVVGDRRYGSTVNAQRLMLHAWKLEHSSFGTLEAPIPAHFNAAARAGGVPPST